MQDKISQKKQGPNWGQISFVVLMLGLTALFVLLGTWQVQRLADKEALVAVVEDRLHQSPEEFPAEQAWSDLTPEDIDYRSYRLSGQFDHSQTVLVFTNLTDPVGRYRGVGYWVLAPLTLDQGGIVWINRGFVPDTQASAFADGGDAPDGPVSVTGVARQPQLANSFTPDPDLAARREWVLDPARLNVFLAQNGEAVAPVIIDEVAGEPGALPQGGETQVEFPNRHLEYAGTWYLFAAITPIMLGFWLWRQRRPTNLADNGKDN